MLMCCNQDGCLQKLKTCGQKSTPLIYSQNVKISLLVTNAHIYSLLLIETRSDDQDLNCRMEHEQSFLTLWFIFFIELSQLLLSLFYCSFCSYYLCRPMCQPQQCLWQCLIKWIYIYNPYIGHLNPQTTNRDLHLPTYAQHNTTQLTRELHGDKKSSPLPLRTQMFCPHYRCYRGNTTEIVPITEVTAVSPQ